MNASLSSDKSLLRLTIFPFMVFVVFLFNFEFVRFYRPVTFAETPRTLPDT